MSLNKEVIKDKLGDLSNNLPIIVYKTIDSTNTQAKRYAECNERGRAVFIAEGQSAGRGRLGRSFISEGGKGLYLSILLNEELPAESATSLTTYMAVIAARAIESLSGVKVDVKWVNDLYLGGKKLAGILTEGRASSACGLLDYAVIGVGINLLRQSFDTDVARIATTLEDGCGKRIDVNELAALIIKSFFASLPLVGSKEIAAEYKSRSFLIGESVTVIKPTESYEATVTDVTDKCELLLTLPSGKTELLRTGEVSVRKIN